MREVEAAATNHTGCRPSWPPPHERETREPGRAGDVHRLIPAWPTHPPTTWPISAGSMPTLDRRCTRPSRSMLCMPDSPPPRFPNGDRPPRRPRRHRDPLLLRTWCERYPPPRDGVHRRSSSVALYDPRHVVTAHHAQGPLQLQDLGGYPTADGGQTRWGRLYRSDSMHTILRPTCRCCATRGAHRHGLPFERRARRDRHRAAR